MKRSMPRNGTGYSQGTVYLKHNTIDSGDHENSENTMSVPTGSIQSVTHSAGSPFCYTQLHEWLIHTVRFMPLFGVRGRNSSCNPGLVPNWRVGESRSAFYAIKLRFWDIVECCSVTFVPTWIDKAVGSIVSRRKPQSSDYGTSEWFLTIPD